MAKVNKTIGLIRKLQLHFPRNCLSTIGKSYVRSHLDYDEVIYDKAYNEFFYKKIESSQYNAAIAITGALRDTSSEELFQELGLKFLKTIVYFIRYLKINHHLNSLVKFHRNPQTNMLPETLTMIKFLFSHLKTIYLKIPFSLRL